MSVSNTKAANTLPTGFTFRPATMDDLASAVELFNICSVDQMGVESFSLNEVRVEWGTPKFNLKTNMRLVFSPEGRLVGHIEVWDIRHPPVHPWIWGRVHPDFEGMGIGSFLMTWAEERARQAIPRVPQGARVSMRSGAVNEHKATTQFLEDWGMTFIRRFLDMEITFNGSPPTPKLPENITICTYADKPDLKAVYLAMNDAFKDHWGHVEQPLEEGLEQWRHWVEEDEEFDPTLWFLAMDGNEIAGMSLCHHKAAHDPDMGWVHVLGVRRPWRKLGLGLALLHHSFTEFHRRGKLGAGLGVDASSLTGATRLYEKAGMHVARQFDDYEKELRPGEELSTQSIAG
jgi:GNAT superfamily N-acetyltransferase